MRTERQMMELIKSVAEGDERIRAVYMNGSRANPDIPPDIFQDYDIVYVVTDTASFLHKPGWISVFGELAMIQEPDRLDLATGQEHDFTRSYGYLMLFTDGNRIDLTLQTIPALREEYGTDSLTVPLLDKDGLLASLPAPTDRSYWVDKPTAELYERACNNFWWCLQNVAKGLWRKEILYARQMLEVVVREMLDDMVGWWIGLQHGFRVNPGKMGKHFQRYLPGEVWEQYLATCSSGDIPDIWAAVFAMSKLFRTLAQDVASAFDFDYPHQDDANITAYLTRVKRLP